MGQQALQEDRLSCPQYLSPRWASCYANAGDVNGNGSVKRLRRHSAALGTNQSPPWQGVAPSFDATEQPTTPSSSAERQVSLGGASIFTTRGAP